MTAHLVLDIDGNLRAVLLAANTLLAVSFVYIASCLLYRPRDALLDMPILFRRQELAMISFVVALTMATSALSLLSNNYLFAAAAARVMLCTVAISADLAAFNRMRRIREAERLL